jgi:hypothetical protein
MAEVIETADESNWRVRESIASPAAGVESVTSTSRRETLPPRLYRDGASPRYLEKIHSLLFKEKGVSLFFPKRRKRVAPSSSQRRECLSPPERYECGRLLVQKKRVDGRLLVEEKKVDLSSLFRIS